MIAIKGIKSNTRIEKITIEKSGKNYYLQLHYSNKKSEIVFSKKELLELRNTLDKALLNESK